MDACFVDIEVSKDRLDVHVLPEGEAFATPRTGAGIDEIARRQAGRPISHVAIEATGGFATVVAAGLAGAGLPVVVVNPARVRHFAKALGARAKTDPVDAIVIARFAAATRPEVRALADEAARLLADLVARRRQIVEMLAAERQRDKCLERGRTKASVTRLIVALEKELASVDEDIDASVRGSPAWRETEDLLTSVPGVGPITARTLLADLPKLGKLDRGQIAVPPGLAPYTRQSGQGKGKSFIGGGR